MINCTQPPDATVPDIGFSQIWSTMTNFNVTCTNDCSGHGDCYDGVCFCEVLCLVILCNNLYLRTYPELSNNFRDDII